MRHIGLWILSGLKRQMMLCALSARPDFPVAVSTIHRFVTPWLERDFSAFSAGNAYGWKPLAYLGKTADSSSLARFLSCLPAGWAAFGDIRIALGRKFLLLPYSENIVLTAIVALKWLVLKTQLDDLLSFLS